MQRVRTALLTTVFITGLMTPGCDGFMNCKCSNVLPYFNIEGIKLANYTTNGPIAPNQKVEWAAYTLSVRYDMSYFALQEPTHFQPFSLISSAYACDCVANGEEGSKEQIKDFWVITKNDFDAQHLANDTINDLLEIRQYPKNIALNEYVAAQTTTIREQAYELVLNKKPELNTELKVEVQVKLTNGEQYQATTEPVMTK